MEATGSGALLRQSLIVPRRRFSGVAGLMPARVKMGNGFKDEGYLRYYASSATATAVRCGTKKEEKTRMKLAKGLEKNLSALYSMDLGADKDQISDAAKVLLSQLTKLRAEAKEMKKARKQAKAAAKASESSSSSSESSDSECETMSKRRDRITSITLQPESCSDEIKDPIASIALETQVNDLVEEAEKNFELNLGTECGKIEVCMGGKCKRSGAVELMAELEKTVGMEGAVVGCKCMGKCREGPNVRVVGGGETMKKGPVSVGVGVEDVGVIVADFFGEKKDVGLLAT